MPKTVGQIWGEVTSSPDGEWITWGRAFFCSSLGLPIAFFATDDTLYLVLLGPMAMMLAFILVEAWQRQPRHGKFGRVGRLSASELAKAQSKLRPRKS